MTIAFWILYGLGGLSAFIICAFMVGLGGSMPRPKEWLAIILIIFFWPLSVPYFVIKFFT